MASEENTQSLAARRRQFEAYIEMLPATDPVFEELTRVAERRLLELARAPQPSRRAA